MLRNLELKDSISIAVDRIQRGFDPLEKQVAAMRDFGLTDNDARIFIYRAFLERAVRGAPRNLMSAVHNNYFSPKHPEFEARSLWSLSNAFTSAFKELAPTKQFEVTARLGAFLANPQDALIPQPAGFFEGEPVDDADRNDPIDVEVKEIVGNFSDYFDRENSNKALEELNQGAAT